MGSNNLMSLFGNGNTNYFLSHRNFEPSQPDRNRNDQRTLHKEDEAAEEGINIAFKKSRLRSLNMPHIGIAEMLFHQKPWPLDKLNERRKNLLKLPQIAKNEAAMAADPEMAMAWNMLADCFHLFFPELAVYDELENKWVPNPKVYKVDWDFATSPSYVQSVITDLKDNLLNDPAKRAIEKKLIEEYKGLGKRKYFDFTATPEIEWDKHSYQQRSVNHLELNDPVLAYKAVNIPQYRALGDFNISALSKGYVEPHPDGGNNVCVSEVYIFVNDHFNFEGESPLGIWDFKNMRYVGDFNILDNYLLPGRIVDKESINDKYMLYNSDFIDFIKNTGYGRNFRIVSPLQKVNEFKPDCWKAKW